jgi:hypothetical protein
LFKKRITAQSTAPSSFAFMSTRRRIGVSIATTEAARRQLMQPVVCWEKVWTVPENAASNSSVKIYKWVKTDRKQVSSLTY